MWGGMLDKDKPPHYSVTTTYALTAGGEATQSAFHFFVNVALIRACSAYDYGVFAIIFTTGAIAIININALFANPAAVFIPRARKLSALSLEVTMGSLAVLACGLAAAAVAAGVWLSYGNIAVALFSGAFVGLWPLRIYTKAINFARLGRRNAMRAAISDIAYAMTGFGAPAVLLTLWRVPISLDLAFGSLCLANIVGIVLNLVGRRAGSGFG